MSEIEPQAAPPDESDGHPAPSEPQAKQSGETDPATPPASATAPAFPGNDERPPVVRRPVFSLAGRAAPRLYLAAWLLTLGGILLYLGLRLAHPLSGIPAFVGYEIAFGATGLGFAVAALSQGRQRKADATQGYVGPSPLLLYGAMMALVLFFGFAAIAIWSPIGNATGRDIPDTVATDLELLLNLAAYVALVGLLVVRAGALPWREMLRPSRLFGDPPDSAPQTPPVPEIVHGSVRPGWELGRPRRPDYAGDIGYALALVIPCVLAAGWLGAVAEHIFNISPQDIPSSLPTSNVPLDRALLFVGAAILAPIGEEIFFRAFTTTAWAKTMPYVRAIVQGGLFFAAVHIVNVLSAESTVFVKVALISILVRIPVGIALCWLFLRRRSVYSSMTLHASYNAVLLFASWAV